MRKIGMIAGNVIRENSQPILLLKSLTDVLHEASDQSYDRIFESLQMAIWGQTENVAAREIVKLFQGGMGSFNDLVIHENGKVRVDLMKTFDKLRRDLFTWSVENL